MTRWHQAVCAIGAVAVVASASAIGLAQQAPAAAPQGVAPAPAMKVVVTGENPEVRKLDKEDGVVVSSVNFFRVHWSPAGSGAVCYVTVQGQAKAEDNLKIAIYDNKAVYDYVTHEMFGKIMNAARFAEFTPVPGTITTTSLGATERHETCKSDKHTVVQMYKGLGAGQWGTPKIGPVTMSFVMVPASSGEIMINGKSAPGTWFPRGGGRGSGAYLMFNETWQIPQ